MNGVQILLIIGLGIFVSSMAKRRGVEPGMIIVVLAAAASFIPGVPRLELESEVILAIVIPPLLYSATRGASFANFGANLRSIWALGVVLVAVTCGALGFALLVTLGTLLLQGTTIGWLARALKFDLSAERAETERLREHGRELAAAAAAQPTTDVDASFEAQRLALGKAVRDRLLPEEIARELIEDVDLRQAAHHTGS